MTNLLQEDVKKSAKELGYTHRRLRDLNMYRGSASPFDELILTNKKVLALECKLLRKRKSGNPKSFPFDRVSKVQRDGLLEWSKKDICKSFILVNFRWTNKSGKGTLYAINIVDFLKIEQSIDRKSISLDMFKELAIDIPRFKVGWNLKWLI